MKDIQVNQKALRVNRMLRNRCAQLGLMVFLDLAFARSLFACPFCQGVNGENVVRAEIFSSSFFLHAFWMILPFGIFCLLLRQLHSGSPFVPRVPHRPNQQAKLKSQGELS